MQTETCENQLKQPEVLVQVQSMDSHIGRLNNLSSSLSAMLDRVRPCQPEGCDKTEEPPVEANLTSLMADKNDRLTTVINVIEGQMSELEGYI